MTIEKHRTPDPLHLLQSALHREHDNEELYKKAADAIDDPRVRSLLLELAASEHQHGVLLERALDEFKALEEVQDEIIESFE